MPYLEKMLLVEGISAFLEGGGQVTLDQAFGFRRPGGVSIRRAASNKMRNDILLHLKQSHPEWSGLAPAVASRRMRKAFDQYEAGRWKRERDSLAAPSAEPYASFWRLLRDDMRMPQIDRLREILSTEFNTPFEFRASPSTMTESLRGEDASDDD
ncbi:DUF1896 domain-containing protein [Rhizobium leguminosarum]|uniref:DUF1896 domain-containing protein n=1 Tax=Rhizobium leguminosarum TaxID=384 RepID=UPI001441A3B8|nr:DUF1896 domain-containing protein [Rhizobium leguminosarum]NKJ79645.1 hypothetical protein [Rhizobium leguminosarum bv. viciae]